MLISLPSLSPKLLSSISCPHTSKSMYTMCLSGLLRAKIILNHFFAKLLSMMIHCVLNKDQILYMSHENGIRPLKLIKFPSVSLFFIPVLASLMIPNWLQRSLRLYIHPLLCAEGEWQLACDSFPKRVLISTPSSPIQEAW